MAGAEGGALLDRIASYYHEVVYERDDERTRPWFLVASPWPILGLMAVYLLTVTKILPWFMVNRKPYSLRGTLIGVNLFQIVANLWIGYEMLSSGWMNNYNILCQEVDYSRNPMAVRMASAVYWFFLIKIFDFSDTIFFVLRKKSNQVTFLHLFHHVTTLWLAWIVVKYAPGGTGTFAQLLNTGVHVMMYSYYLLAAMGPSVRPYLWWKKYLTTVQMIQFIVTWLQNFYGLVSGCGYSHVIVCFFLPIVFADFLLFYNFYYQAYKKGPGADKRMAREKRE
uniref:Elongation of very long chain fatty acids protein n=1 Tax=Orthetrum albistylum TaxID=254766 RepID=A0A499UEG9_9ODON|nr:elongation of very long chain fatty acids protein 3 [Orthetrum albistylum]